MPIESTLPAGVRVALTEPLVRRHQAAVWRYLRFLGCAPERADDLTQDVFLELLRRPPEDRGDAALAAWLRRAAFSRFANSGRRPRRDVELDEAALERAWQRANGSAAGDGGAYLAALDRCLGSLSERQVRALRLRYGDGFARAAIAQALGTSPEGAKTLLRRARARLLECIESRLESER